MTELDIDLNVDMIFTCSGNYNQGHKGYSERPGLPKITPDEPAYVEDFRVELTGIDITAALPKSVYSDLLKEFQDQIEAGE